MQRNGVLASMQKANPMKASPNPDLTEIKAKVLPLSKQILCSKSRLMLSLENVINRFFSTFQFDIGYLRIAIAYCYHTVHVNTFVLTESDDNNWYLF
jgi:hypothetical protein